MNSHNSTNSTPCLQYKKIWDKVLGSNEKVEYEFSIGDRYRKFGFGCSIGGIVLFLLFGVAIGVSLLALFGLGVIAFMITWFHYGYYLKVANVYCFTNKRVIIQRGWLSTNIVSIDYSKITDIRVIEPFFQRILTHSGSMIINTAGTMSGGTIISNIEHPCEIKKRLDILKD